MIMRAFLTFLLLATCFAICGLFQGPLVPGQGVMKYPWLPKGVAKAWALLPVSSTPLRREEVAGPDRLLQTEVASLGWSWDDTPWAFKRVLMSILYKLCGHLGGFRAEDVV